MRDLKAFFGFAWIALGSAVLVVGMCLVAIACEVGDGAMALVGMVLGTLGSWVSLSGGLLIVTADHSERNPPLLPLLILPCICFARVAMRQPWSAHGRFSTKRESYHPVPVSEDAADTTRAVTERCVELGPGDSPHSLDSACVEDADEEWYGRTALAASLAEQQRSHSNPTGTRHYVYGTATAVHNCAL